MRECGLLLPYLCHSLLHNTLNCTHGTRTILVVPPTLPHVLVHDPFVQSLCQQLRHFLSEIEPLNLQSPRVTPAQVRNKQKMFNTKQNVTKQRHNPNKMKYKKNERNKINNAPRTSSRASVALACIPSNIAMIDATCTHVTRVNMSLVVCKCHTMNVCTHVTR